MSVKVWVNEWDGGIAIFFPNSVWHIRFPGLIRLHRWIREAEIDKPISVAANEGAESKDR